MACGRDRVGPQQLRSVQECPVRTRAQISNHLDRIVGDRCEEHDATQDKNIVSTRPITVDCTAQELV
jgi:hypothetical protein